MQANLHGLSLFLTKLYPIRVILSLHLRLRLFIVHLNMLWQVLLINPNKKHREVHAILKVQLVIMRLMVINSHHRVWKVQVSMLDRLWRQWWILGIRKLNGVLQVLLELLRSFKNWLIVLVHLDHILKCTILTMSYNQ